MIQAQCSLSLVNLFPTCWETGGYPHQQLWASEREREDHVTTALINDSASAGSCRALYQCTLCTAKCTLTPSFRFLCPDECISFWPSDEHLQQSAWPHPVGGAEQEPSLACLSWVWPGRDPQCFSESSVELLMNVTSQECP